MTPTLAWLGYDGFAIEYSNIRFLVDPCLAEPERNTPADLILCTSARETHLDTATLKPLLKSSPRAKVVLPKSAAEPAKAAGIPYERMTTTDADLRVEFFKDGLYSRVYAVPSSTKYTPDGGYPELGYLIRFGAVTIYHPGHCVPYPELAQRLRPYNVTVAIATPRFTPAEAAQLAEDIGARWLIPIQTDGFVDHLLGHHPSQRFKVFTRGEAWPVPAE